MSRSSGVAMGVAVLVLGVLGAVALRSLIGAHDHEPPPPPPLPCDVQVRLTPGELTFDRIYVLPLDAGVPHAQLAKLLIARRRTCVVVEADPSVGFPTIREVLETATDAGYSSIQFSVPAP